MLLCECNMFRASGINASRKSIITLESCVQRFFKGWHLHNGEDGTEDLLPGQPVLGSNIGEYRYRHSESNTSFCTPLEEKPSFGSSYLRTRSWKEIEDTGWKSAFAILSVRICVTSEGRIE